MHRQQVLYDTSKAFEFVFTEAALYLLPCSRQVMLGQLDRLLSLGMDNVTLGRTRNARRTQPSCTTASLTC